MRNRIMLPFYTVVSSCDLTWCNNIVCNSESVVIL